MIRLIFTRKHSLGTIVLRTFLWSKWSHCAVIDGDEVIEAVMGKGVIVRPLAELVKEASLYEIVEVPCPYPEEVITQARKEVGKSYDWLGILGIGFRRRWQNKDSWFCSELVAHAFHQAGWPIMRAAHYRITPRDLYLPSWHLYK